MLSPIAATKMEAKLQTDTKWQYKQLKQHKRWLELSAGFLCAALQHSIFQLSASSVELTVWIPAVAEASTEPLICLSLFRLKKMPQVLFNTRFAMLNLLSKFNFSR